VCKVGAHVVPGRVTDTTDKRYVAPETGKKYERATATPCRSGIYRTAAMISGTNDVGENKKSAWTYSKEATDPFKQG
jgi:hypothetical protein